MDWQESELGQICVYENSRVKVVGKAEFLDAEPMVLVESIDELGISPRRWVPCRNITHVSPDVNLV